MTPRRAPRSFVLAAMLLLLAVRAHGQCERQRFLPAPGTSHGQFGEALSLSGQLLAVGSPSGAPLGQGGGTVTILRRAGGAWVHEALLVASDGEPDERFGASVALDGDVLVVGAPRDDAAGPDSGSVYVFGRFGTAWVQLGKLVGQDTAAGDQFGAAVAVSGFTIAVGARRHDVPLSDGGAVYVFENPLQGPIWTQAAKLAPAGLAAGDAFGASVALDGDLLVAGADLADLGGVSAGGAWAFRRTSAWNQAAALPSPQAQAQAFFGRTVAVSGTQIVVGAPGQLVPAWTGGPLVTAGAVFAYRDDGGSSFAPEGTLVPQVPEGGESFGSALSLTDGIVLIGAPLSDVALPNAGAVHMGWRDPSGGAWWLETVVTASDAASGDNFGSALTFDDRYAVVGARYHPLVGPSAGAAYLFRGVTDLPTWSALGNSLSGAVGDPCLFGEGSLAPDEIFVLSLNNARPASSSVLVIGIAEWSLPFKGGTFVPSPDIMVAGLPTLTGVLDVAAPWPAGIPSDVDVFVQYWVLDPDADYGFAATNGMVGRTP